VAARSKAWVCGRSLAGIAVSNPAKSTEFCLFIMLVLRTYRSLQLTDPSSRGVLPSVYVCVCVCVCVSLGVTRSKNTLHTHNEFVEELKVSKEERKQISVIEK
jgi:hypothetical protein